MGRLAYATSPSQIPDPAMIPIRTGSLSQVKSGDPNVDPAARRAIKAPAADNLIIVFLILFFKIFSFLRYPPQQTAAFGKFMINKGRLKNNNATFFCPVVIKGKTPVHIYELHDCCPLWWIPIFNCYFQSSGRSARMIITAAKNTII